MARNPEAFERVRRCVDELVRRFPYLAEEPRSVPTYFYWRYCDNAPLPFIPLRILRRLTSPETILRRFRELGYKREEAEPVWR